MCCLAASPAGAATAAIDATKVQQTIRGFGGATVFRPTEPLTEADLDSIFGNGTNQLGLTILRIRVSSSDSWRELELANAKGAIKRGAIVMASPWSPPASMKTNNSLIDGELKPSSYAAYATYLSDFAAMMAAKGASLYAISIQNEPDIDVDYESCVWTPAQMLDFCKNHAGNIRGTRVIAPESFQFRRNISDPILNDATAAANVHIIGGHIYGGGLSAYPLALSKGKELWMTEHLELTTDWNGALDTAKEIHDCLAEASFSAYIWWYVKRYYGPLGEDGVITKRGHVISQFSKFIRPDYVRVDATKNPSSGVYVSAYKRDKMVIVAINQGTTPVQQSFSFTGVQPTSVTPWLTSETVSMTSQPDLAVTGGSFTATLPARSVTTFVGDLPLAAPVITTAPMGHTITAGTTVVLEATATGEFLSYQWMHDGVAIQGATSRALTVTNSQSADGGNYTVVISNTGGQVTSAPAMLRVSQAGNPGRLIGIATRSFVGTGDNVQIAGFVIDGSTARTAIIRASGPALSQLNGMSGTLDDPMIEVHDQKTQTIIASSDDWDFSLATHFARMGFLPWNQGSKDAALVLTLEPGPYSVVVRGKGSSTGIALIEVYDGS